MASSIQLDLSDGAVRLLDLGLVIRPGIDQTSAETMLSEFRKGAVDHANGYSWLNFHRLTFGTMPCVLALGFRQGALTQINFGVVLPHVTLELGWPTREAIDDEISFVRSVFRDQLQREFGDKPEHFGWGVVWSGFDPKGFTATAGIRYT
jgi:hypothetical protein